MISKEPAREPSQYFWTYDPEQDNEWECEQSEFDDYFEQAGFFIPKEKARPLFPPEQHYLNEIWRRYFGQQVR